MPVQLNHTIIRSRDGVASATFLAEVLGLDPPKPWGPFQVVALSNGVTLDFMTVDEPLGPGHFAFLVTEAEFDEILGRIKRYGATFYADPGGQQANEWNTHDGGRGLYWSDPDGHWLEIITRPYGSGS